MNVEGKERQEEGRKEGEKGNIPRHSLAFFTVILGSSHNTTGRRTLLSRSPESRSGQVRATSPKKVSMDRI